MPYKSKEKKAKYNHDYRATYVEPPQARTQRRVAQAKFQRTPKGKSVHLEQLYGITFDHKAAMYKKQKGLCGVCFKPLPSISQAHYDHDHDTGQERELLHRECNFLVGIFEKYDITPEQVRVYIRKHSHFEGGKR